MSEERILIVDGDIAFSAMLKTRLEAIGYLVDFAASANEALAIMKAKWLDLIVLGSVLQGGVDGFELFKEIKSKSALQRIPIVVQSSKAFMKKAFERVGAKTYFIKPYSFETVLNEICDILTKKILVLADHYKTAEIMARVLTKYDFQIDIVTKIRSFNLNISRARYALIIIQAKIKGIKADELMTIVRGSNRNIDVPVVIFNTETTSKMTNQKSEEWEKIKNNCADFGPCEIIDKGYSTQQFLKATKKYLV